MRPMRAKPRARVSPLYRKRSVSALSRLATAAMSFASDPIKLHIRFMPLRWGLAGGGGVKRPLSDLRFCRAHFVYRARRALFSGGPVSLPH